MSQTGLENRVQIRAVIDHAVRANVAIYAADARGLQAVVPGGGLRPPACVATPRSPAPRCRISSAASPVPRTRWSRCRRTRADAPLGQQRSRQGLRSRHRRHVVMLHPRLQQHERGARRQMRRITVKTTRPGVTLSTRSGYYAPRDFKHSTRRPRAAADGRAADGPPPTDLHVFVWPAYFSGWPTRGSTCRCRWSCLDRTCRSRMPPPKIAPPSTSSASCWTKRAGQSAASAIP